MAALVVPAMDAEPWPTLGPQVCAFIEATWTFGPGSLQGRPYVIDPELRAFLYRAYEVFPRGHEWAGRRRFKRCGLSVRKGLAKTEKEAIIVGTELHPDGPVRCDGFDAYGQPVGRPVVSPYIPMLAYTKDQVEELAYGALKFIVENSADADLFDASLERILRLDARGREDGVALPIAQAPDAADGKRTTLNAYDEPHRMVLPRQIKAHTTMEANLPKRPLEDPWSLYVGTAGEPGEGSVAETLHLEAKAIDEGRVRNPQLFYVYRWAGGSFDLDDYDQRIEAVREATGPAGEWGPGQFADIAGQWDRPGVDKAYLERVWLNRWRKSDAAAFDLEKWKSLGGPVMRRGRAVTVGFDGARFRDSTGLVVTDLESGCQRLYAGWERPAEAETWEVPEAEVTAAAEEIDREFAVLLAYGDPPYWTSTMGEWASRWPYWREWWTNRVKPMAYAVRAYSEAVDTGAVRHESGRTMALEAVFEQHIGNAGRDPVQLYDDEGRQLFVLRKVHEERKFDFAMAAVLSWQARLDALSKGLKAPERSKSTRFGRIY